MKFQKIIFVVALLLAVFVAANLSFAAEQPARKLEINYPAIPGATTPTTVKTPLPDYINYIFNFSLWIGGLLVFGMLILGGFRWFSSQGSAEVINDAKDQISSAFLGLVILLSSYIILYTINPQLKLLDVKIGEPPKINIPTITGVYFGTKDAIWDNNQKNDKWTDANTRDINDFKDFLNNEPIKKIRYVNEENVNWKEKGSWTAILHNDANNEGSCRIVLENSDNVIGGDPKYGKIDQVSSATIFYRKDIAPEGPKVQLCSEPNYGGKCKDFSPGTGEPKLFTEDNDYKELSENVRSIKVGTGLIAVLIEAKKDAMGVLKNPLEPGGKCQVFRNNDSDLKNDPIGQCGITCGWSYGKCTPCASYYAVLPIK